MAVEIPVYVDIEQAFQDAAKRVPKAISPLEKQISKKTLNVQVDVGTAKHPQLRKFKDLLNESQSSATQLERAISAVNKQIREMQKAGGFKPGKDLKTSERDLIALRAALETKLESGSFIDSAVDKVKAVASGASSAEKSATTAIKNTNKGLLAQDGLLGKIMGRLSAYTAVFAGLRLIRNIRETTAEFEMQRVALGGIIQDATKANQLFGQIKAAAVESPFEIKDLVSFTKQLSAYRIETDRLFDVTMRLADVSAGLGVDMSRLVLAYGQVRAASVLRGQELRQFTEAGIPLVDLLAKKFTQLRGEMVSTGEVFELISERAVPFAMIEEIFNDMTNAGGIFYQMQLKQSETLKGQWMKLKDVISIAYDEMGRTALVNQAMTGWIHLISDLVKNWERISSVVNVAVYSYLAYQAAVKRLIPFYNMQQRSIERQIKLEKQQQIEQIKLASKTDQLTKADQRRIAQIKKMTAEDLKRIYAMDKMSQSQAMMFYWRNKDNKEIVKAVTQTGILTKAQMNAIKNMNMWQIRLKVWGSSIRTFFKTIGTAISSFWPIAAVSALITVITSLIQKNKEQEEAIKRVDKAYSEQEQNLLSIENAYRKIQKAIIDVADEQSRAAKEAASFGEKLAYAQKIVEALKKFGLGGDFDLSLLNTGNIDDFVDAWLKQLNEANELTRDWGRNLAQVANAWEASILGIHFAGDNLNTDIKQLTSAFVKLTSDKGYRSNVDSMRNYVEQLEVQYKGHYDLLSIALGEEAKLAIASKRRNESEYQYQMRLIKNYEKIRQYAQSDRFMLSGAMKSFKSMSDALTNFEVKLSEVEREFDKTWGAMEGKDEITIKMAIDKMFAENQWEDWLKEAWIERVNGKYQMNIQMTPTIAKVNVPKGMKGIIATEFSGLFTEQELENMNSVSEIGKAIEEKMKNAATAIAEADRQANNLANSDLWAAQTKEKIKKAQLAIDTELAKEEKDRNQDAINESIALIDALTKQNSVYDEQIQKKKESAKAELELAKAARERLLDENLSDIGKDIKQAFPGLLKDAYREATDENYVSRFLISDDDLAKIKDGVDAYDLFAKNMKAIADEREKMAEAGVTDLTVAEEQSRLDERRIEIEQKLSDVNKEIADWNYEEAKAQYDNLRLAVQQAATKNARLKAEADLAKFVEATNFDERAILVIERERLETQLGITNAALGAKNAILNTFSAMDEAETFWKDFGKRYNFTLKDKGPKGASGQDPWIILIKNRMKFMQDFQKGVEDLDKFMAHSASLGREQGIMKGRGLSVGIDTEQLKGDAEELRKWYSDAIDSVVKKIQSMGGKQFSGLGVTEILAKDLTGRKIQKYQELLQELWKGLTDFDTNKIRQSIEDSLNRVKDEIKRSETARNFYQNILDLTGDEELATSMSVSVYGGIGDDFKDRIKKQLVDSLSSLDAESFAGLDEKIREAFDAGDYEYLAKNIAKVPESLRGMVNQVASDARKYNADIVSDLLKNLKKAQTYAQKQEEIAKQSVKRISEINALSVPQSTKDSLLKQNAQKVAEDTAKLQYEAFKDSPMYVEMFSRLETASTRMLQSMRENIVALKDQWKDLDPRNLKEMQSRLNQIDQQLAAKNPFKALIDSIKEYRSLTKQTSRREADDTAVSATNYAEEQKRLLEVAKQNYQIAVQQHGIKSSIAIAARDEMEVQSQTTEDAIKNAEAAQNTANAYHDTAKRISAAADEMQKWTGYVTDSLSGVGEIVETFASEDFAETFNIISEGLGKTMQGATGIASSIGRLATGDLTAIPSLIQGIGDVISGIFGSVNKIRIKELNKKIEVQKRLIEDLEYEYGRLEKAIADSFGTDYIANYNKQLEALRAKEAAYREQARLENEKGKKKDEEKIREYNKSATETADSINDLNGQLSKFFTGTDLTSAAKDFAEAWIEAYKEFGSTTAAMKEKFNDMIESMVVNSLAAQLIQGILKPVFDQIDDAAKDGDLTAREIGAISAMLPERMQMINDAMTGMVNELGAAGINLRQQAGQFTGIARNIANASEESITGLAAGINTQNFYMQHIDMNVALILSYLTGGTTTASASVTGQTPDPYKEQMLLYAAHIPAIDQNLADLLVEVRKVIKPKGTTSTHYVATNL